MNTRSSSDEQYRRLPERSVDCRSLRRNREGEDPVKPFVSTKSGGFGIGAFEARELVKAMRGRLEVESREGLGSRFIVRIPAAAAIEIYQAITDTERKQAS